MLNESMKQKRRNPSKAEPVRWYRGADIPTAVIRRFVRQVAERFQPEKIILFGSHAYGQPHEDSDVDILVVMPARNQLDQAVIRSGNCRSSTSSSRNTSGTGSSAEVEGAEPTNNAAEQALRQAVIWRKLSFGRQSAAASSSGC